MDMKNNDLKPINVREWYDFIGVMAEGLQFIHTGGKEATEYLVQGCGIDAASQVLDVGCGGGYTACWLAKEFGCQVVGIDISEEMLSHANKRAHKEGVSDLVTFQHADVYELPFEDDHFDVALVESVLTPLTGDKTDALKEIYRVINHGGYIGLNEAVFKEDMPSEIRDITDMHPAISNPFSEKTLREATNNAGFTISKCKILEQADLPSPLKQLGCKGLIMFLFKAYPRILIRMLTDKRIREAAKIDDQITKVNKQYMSAMLVIAHK